MSSTPLTLVVLAAGMGSRYGGLKQLDAVGPGGATLMDCSVFDARRAGFTDVVFVIRPDMEDAFAPFAAGRYGSHLAVRIAPQRLADPASGVTIPPGRVKPQRVERVGELDPAARDERRRRVDRDLHVGRHELAGLRRPGAPRAQMHLPGEHRGGRA